MSQTVLIVDDDPVQRRILEEIIRKSGYATLSAESGEIAVDILTGERGPQVSLMILDLVMPDLDGMGVLERIKPEFGNLPIIVQTAHGGIETVVSAMRAGADDFVVKPVSPERLQVSIKNALKANALVGEITRIKNKAGGIFTFEDMIAHSPGMINVMRLGERAAKSNIPILIEGQSGVGKEVVARAIQGCSDRKGKPFISVNCGALPENLVESILFGHEKGSFTGASQKHMGKFQEASGGTLFLDEVGELAPHVQVKLLRALQEGEIDPVGAKKPVKVDFRLISATNRNMIDMVTQGEFREDLYYRLNVFPVFVPPLTERKEDIIPLVNHFISRFSIEEGRKISAISEQALELLCAYQWPGNVRQLENTIFRAIVLCDSDCLNLSEFPQIAALVDGFDVEVPAAPKPVEVKLPEGPVIIGGDLPAIIPTHTANGSSLGIPATLEDGHMRRLDEIEADMIRLALERYRGHMSQVARKLGIGRSTLYRKVRDMGLEEFAS